MTEKSVSAFVVTGGIYTMLRSLFSGVAGLKTHQVKMDVIGNNIANVNTTAYKASSITFSEMMSQTTQNAGGPNAANGTGGTNARQIGLGVKSGAINVNISSQGASQSTGNPFDIMISGSNFFVVSNGMDTLFTRDGSFYIDGGGNLAMTSTGYNVMGWGVDSETGDIKKDTVAALRIMNTANMTYPPEATSEAYVSGILDKYDKNVTSVSGKSINLNFFDALGYSYTAKFVFKQSDDVNNYSIELDKILDSSGQEIDISGVEFGNKGVSQEKERKVSFNTAAYTWDGKVLMSADKSTVYADVSQMFDGNQLKTGEYTYDGKTMSVQESMDNIAKAYGYEGATEEFLSLFTKNDAGDQLSVQQMLANLAGGNPGDAGALPVFTADSDDPTFTVVGRKYDGAYIDFDGDNGKFAGLNGSSTQNSLIMKFVSPADDPGKYGNFSDIEIDFSQCSMFDNKGTSTIGATNGDLEGLGTGRRLGKMIGVSVQSNGMIYASYDNGMTKLLGQIATAEFPNASGLEKAGDNVYKTTLNSGDFDGIGVDVTANGGYMSSGQLEMSNVDLSSEFTEMITTQRGFQANSRIITVSDTLLEELTNLKR